MHKGFKCLDISEGRIYISRDVVFDEIVYPFAQLHPNAGARLRSEVLLLPPTLLNPSSSFGTAILLIRLVMVPCALTLLLSTQVLLKIRRGLTQIRG